MYVVLCACIHLATCVQMCGCMWKPGVHTEVFLRHFHLVYETRPLTLSTLLFKTGSFIELVTHQFSYAGSPWACDSTLVLQMLVDVSTFAPWALGTQTWALVSPWQVLYQLSYLLRSYLKCCFEVTHFGGLLSWTRIIFRWCFRDYFGVRMQWK